MTAEEIAIVAFAQTPAVREYPDSEAWMLMDLTNQLMRETGLGRSDSYPTPGPSIGRMST